jgi:hypothetical protein
VSRGTEHEDDDLIPEADALEQREPVVDESEGDEPTELGDQVPEADALEQAAPVPDDEEAAPR